MNHIYKVVFNKATGTFVAVAEYAKGQGKKSNKSKVAHSSRSTIATKTSSIKLNYLVLAIVTSLGLSAQGYAAENTYFHVNDTGITQAGNDTNLDTIDGIGGAKGAYSVAIGVGAQALGEGSVAIGGRDTDPNRTPVNTADGSFSTVSGGIDNTIRADRGVISGGVNNNILTTGDKNAATGSELSSTNSTISGGTSNSITNNDTSTIGGGFLNEIKNPVDKSFRGNTIAGGERNKLTGSLSTVGGGSQNIIDNGTGNTVSGGTSNQVSGGYTVISGGNQNKALADYSSIGGGFRNTVDGERATISGGFQNKASGQSSTISGGYQNKALSSYGTIAGGGQNTIAATGGSGFIAGSGNTLEAPNSAIIGSGNTLSADQQFSFVLGNGTQTTQANSVTLGHLSADKAGTTQTEAQVGDLTYGDFSGVSKVENGVVSVGAAGQERQVVNVGAGEVSQASTDAINGSQLYAVGSTVNNLAGSVASNMGGDAIVNQDGSITYTDIGGTGEDNIHDAISSVEGKQNYFHVNDTGAVQAGNDTNLDKVDDIGGAQGIDSLAAGIGAQAAGESAVSVGVNNIVNSDFSTALGIDNEVAAEYSTVIGYQNIVEGESNSVSGEINTVESDTFNNTILGDANTVKQSAENNTVIGNDNVIELSAENNTVIGDGTTVGLDANKITSVGNENTYVDGTSDAAVLGSRNTIDGGGSDRNTITGFESFVAAVDTFTAGNSNRMEADRSAIVGFESEIREGSEDSYLMGSNASILFESSKSVALGSDSEVGQFSPNAVALGSGASVVDELPDAVALGSQSMADRAALTGSTTSNSAITDLSTNTVYALSEDAAVTDTVKGTLSAVSVGNADSTRQITNVAAGSLDTDAVNVSQLRNVASELDKDTYFHVNDGTNAGTGNATTNLGKIDEAAGATGENSLAAGINASAVGVRSIAVGTSARANGQQGLAVGNAARADGDSSIAVGVNSEANGLMGLSVGRRAGRATNAGRYNTFVGAQNTGAESQGEVNTYVGTNAGFKATGDNNNYLGSYAGNNAVGSENTYVGMYAGAKTDQNIGSDTASNQNTVMGHQAGLNLNGNNNIITGYQSGVDLEGERNIVIGNRAGVRSTAIEDTVAIGTRSQASANNATAVGTRTQATAERSVALGSSSVADRAAITAGASTSTTAAAADNTVYALEAADDADKAAVSATVKGDLAAVSVGNADSTRQITNVAAGSEDSDAVNVSQLKAVANTPLTFTGNTNADTDNDGSQQQLGSTLNIIGSTSPVNGLAEDTSGDTSGTAYSAKNVQTVVTDDQIQIQMSENPEFNSVVIGNDTNNTTLTSTANGLSVGGDKITNVANGDISSTSTDAVNGSQLNAIDRDTYFHTNATGKKQPLVGSNKGKLDATAGASGVNATTAGRNARATGDSGVAVGNGAWALDDNALAIGKGARVDNYAVEGKTSETSDGIAIGTNARSVQGGLRDGALGGFIPSSPTVDNYLPGSTKGIAIGKDTYASESTVDIGAKSVNNQTEGANRRAVTSVGADSYAAAHFSTVVGSYSEINTDESARIGRLSSQGLGSTVTGTLNTINADSANTEDDYQYDGVANVINGAGNTINNSNGTLVVGSGNTVSDSRQAVNVDTSNLSFANITDGETLNGVLKDAELGSVAVMGGGNTVDNALYSNVQGVKNSLTGITDGESSAFVSIDGYKNTATNVSNLTQQGSNNTVENADQNIVMGDNNTLKGDNPDRSQAKRNIIVGFQDAEGQIGKNITNNQAIGSNVTVAENTTYSALLGDEAKVTGNGAVALGAYSDANRAALTAGAPTSITAAAADNTVFALEQAVQADKDAISATVKGDLAAVSVGNSDSTRQITNVAAGSENSDAVNVSQLKAVANVAAAKTKVEKGTNTTVTNEVDETTGATTYTVNARDTTASAGSTAVSVTGGELDADTNVRAYSIDLSDDTKSSIADGKKHNTVVAGDNVSITKGTNTAEGVEYTVNAEKSTVSSESLAVNVGPTTDGITDYKVELKADDQTTLANATTGFYVDADVKATTDKAADNIKLTETVTYTADDTNVVTTVRDNEIGFKLADDVTIANSLTVGPVTINKDTGINAGNTKITNLTAGTDPTDAVNVSQLTTQVGASKEVVTSEDGSIEVTTTQDPGSNANIFDVSVNTDEKTITKDADGNIMAKTSPLTNLDNGLVDTPTNSNALATSGDIANAINNSGFTVKANGDSGELINPGDEVDFINGDNIEITRTNGQFTVGTKADVAFDNVTVGPVSINKDTGINAGNTKITNLTAGTDPTDAVNVSQLTTQVGASREVVKNEDGSIKVSTTQDPDTNANIFDVSVNTDGTTITKDDDGNIMANTSVLTNADSGLVDTPTNPKALATSGDIANAINNSGFTVKANSEDGELINPGEEVDFIDGNNISITRDGGQFTVATKADVTFDNVTVGPVSINKDTGIDAGNTKITNLTAGTDPTDAVNVSQLTTQVGASREVVKNEDGSIEVTTTQDPNSKANIFDVSVNTDEKTITKDADGNIMAKTSPLTNLDNGLVDTPTNSNALATSGDIANAINNSGFNVIAAGNETGAETTLVKPSNTVTYAAGDNLTVAQEGTTFTYATAKDVVFDSMTAGPVVINNTGIDAGNTKITNVAKGEADTDAVNVSQLNAVETLAKASKTTVKAGRNVSVAQQIDPTTGVTEYKISADSTSVSSKSDAISVESKRDSNGNTEYVLDFNEDTRNLITNSVKSVTGDSNITATTDADRNVTVELNDTITVEEANADRVNVGDVTIDAETGTMNGLSNKTFDPKNFVSGQAATEDQLAQVVVESSNASKGWKLSANGDKANATDVKPTNVVDFSASNNNIVVSKDNNDIKVGLADDIKVDSVQAGNTTVNNDGVAIKAPANNEGRTDVTLTAQGLNNGGNRITNVGPGVDPMDAVNVSQLNDLGYKLSSKIGDVEDDANAGVSSAMAMAALPQAYLPGKSMLTGGMASYNGEGAVAVGVSKLSDNGRWVFKISGSADTEGNAGGAVGAGFHF